MLIGPVLFAVWTMPEFHFGRTEMDGWLEGRVAGQMMSNAVVDDQQLATEATNNFAS